MMQMKPLIVVAGGTGYIGSHVLEMLRAKNLDVLVVARYQERWDRIASQFPMFRFVSIDLSLNLTELEYVLASYPNQEIYIINLAARAFAAQEGEKDPLLLLKTNTAITYTLLETARVLGKRVSKVLEVSSSYVWQDTEGEVIHTEEMPVSPFNEYGRAKVLSETLTRDYCFVHGVPSIVVRVGNVWSVDSPRGVYTAIWQKAISSNDGTAKMQIGSKANKRAILSVESAVNAMLAVLFYGKPGETYNLSGNTPVTLGQFIALVEEITGVIFEVTESAPNTSPTMLVSSSKLRGLGIWQDSTNIRVLLEDAWSRR